MPKTLTIFVNTVENKVTTKELTFDQIVDLAFNPRPTGPDQMFTVTYRRGHGDKPEGSLTEGESVKVKDQMIFNVRATNRS